MSDRDGGASFLTFKYLSSVDGTGTAQSGLKAAWRDLGVDQRIAADYTQEYRRLKSSNCEDSERMPATADRGARWRHELPECGHWSGGA